MAVFHPQTVRCVCGNSLVVQLADSINVKRSPESRDRILRGELHKAACPVCGRHMTVEKPFYYTDLTRNTFFKVLPRGERHMWKKASRELDAAISLIPDAVTPAKGRTLRVIFGMDELREKLIAQDIELDDRFLELFKVLLVYEHPILLRWSRLRLALEAVTDDGLEFSASYEHNQRQFRLVLPGRLIRELAERPDEVRGWVKNAHRNSDIFEAPDHWVNMWRWSPQPSALDRLKSYAEHLRAGEDIDTKATAFKQMLSGLPHGNHLPGWAKRDLRSLFVYAKAKGLQTLEDTLFEIRFGFELENDWSVNEDVNDIDTLWMLLKDLPDTNVEGNTKIREILLDEGVNGGFYRPLSNDIHIGSDTLENQERFEDIVRHEVGHAVHEQWGDLVNDWLTSRFGWRIFGTTDDEINQWISLMGGWGNLTTAQQADVRDALRTVLGSGNSWDPGPTPGLSSGHPWYQEHFGPRLAVRKTGAYWYQNYRTWHRANGKAFFLNYWYRTFMAVDAATLDLVANMPDEYASMSHYEFFAELYALNYDLDDPQRAVIPDDVSQWLANNIGAQLSDEPMLAAPRTPREWETIDRPDKKSEK
ncbi:MAG: CpXC domain-containing protein [Blastocatellia bacterium]